MPIYPICLFQHVKERSSDQKPHPSCCAACAKQRQQMARDSAVKPSLTVYCTYRQEHFRVVLFTRQRSGDILLAVAR